MERRQVGGMQEVFLQLRWKTIRGVERAVSAVEKAGGRVLHAYLPSIMVASVPSDQVDRLVGKGGIVSATIDPLPMDTVRTADRQMDFAVAAWNEHFDLDRRIRAMTSPELGKFWDETERQPPDPPRRGDGRVAQTRARTGASCSCNGP